MKTAPPAKGGTAAATSESQEAERQPPQHPPGILVWPAGLAPPPASGQESQVIARLTTSGHVSDSGECATASGHADLPSGQGKTRTLMTRPGAVNRPPHRSRHKRSRCDRYRSKDRERSQRDQELPRRER